MFKHIDRLLAQSYFKSYICCLTSMLGLYIVVDLFTNLDDFIQKQHGLAAVVVHIASYYGYRTAQIFDRLCEAIVLLAGMFTVAWMQRNNELLPLLSAGVSTRRVVRPVLASACFMLVLTVINQELIIPRIADRLVLDRDDPDGKKDLQVGGCYEPNGIHIEGRSALRHGLVVQQFCCTLPENIARNFLHLTASEARYIPPGEGAHTGGWLLTGTQPAELDHWDNTSVLEQL